MNSHMSSPVLVDLLVRILAATNTHVLLPVVIQSLNNFCVIATQSGKPVLHAKLMAIPWLYLKVHETNNRQLNLKVKENFLNH